MAGNCDVTSPHRVASAPQQRLSFLTDTGVRSARKRHETPKSWNARVRMLPIQQRKNGRPALVKPGVRAEAASFPERWFGGCVPRQPSAKLRAAEGASSPGEREEGNLAHTSRRNRAPEPSARTAEKVLLMPRNSQGLPRETFIFLSYVCPKRGQIAPPSREVLFT